MKNIKKHLPFTLFLLAYSFPTWAMDDNTVPHTIPQLNRKLFENTYTLQHAVTSKCLCFESNKKDRTSHQNKIANSFKFIPRADGVLIQSILTKKYLYRNGNKCEYAQDSAKNSLWDVVLSQEHNADLEKPPPWVIEIKCNKNCLILNDNVPILTPSPEGNSQFWLLHPLYPGAGYSNFFNIIYDFGELIALKHGTKLKKIKTCASSPHDVCGLAIVSSQKTLLNLNPDSQGYKSSYRKIFGTADNYYSFWENISSENEARFKITRVIETEKIFQTTIENAVSTTNKEKTSKENNMFQKDDHMKNAMVEKMDQVSFDKKLNTQINVNLSQSTEESSERAKLNSEGKEKGDAVTTQESQNNSCGLTVKAKAKLPIASVAAEANYSHTSHAEKNNTKHGTENSLEQKNKSKRKTTGDALQEGSTKGEESSKQDLQNKKNTKTSQFSKEKGHESKYAHTIDLEHTISLTQMNSVTNRQKEQWIIEREFFHKPGTMLQVDFYEEAIEFIDTPFSSLVTVSGYAGFIFEPPIPSINPMFRSLRDYKADDQMWCISPSTIVEHLSAPGYEKNGNGCINYKINGKVSLKQPIQIQTLIHEIEHTYLNPKKRKKELDKQKPTKRQRTASV